MLPISVVLVFNMFEILTAYLFWRRQGTVKYKTSVNLSVGAGLSLIETAICVWIPHTVWSKALCFIAVHSLFGALIFDIGRSRIFFGTVVLNALSAASNFTSILLSAFWTGNAAEHMQISDPYCFITVAAGKVLYFLCVMCLTRFGQREERHFRLPKAFYIYPIAVFLLLFFGEYLCTTADFPSDYMLFFLSVCIFLLLSVMLLFLFHQFTVKKENTIYLLQRQTEHCEAEKQYYSVLEKQNEQLRLYAHDAKKHLNAIRALNQDAQIDAYINRISARLYAYGQTGNSGNRMLDILCSAYAAECEDKHIALHWDFRAANLAYVEDCDLVAAFGNLLDNAVEAADKSQKREIFVRAAHKNNYDILIIENSCDTPPQARNKILMTGKTNRELHGLGLKSVSEVLRKYGGDYSWNYNKEKKQFCLTAMLAPPQM